MEKLLDPLREDKGNYNLTRETILLITKLIETNTTLYEIIGKIFELKRSLKTIHPFLFSIRNVIRKILLIIVEQCLIQNLNLNPITKYTKKKTIIEVEEYSNDIVQKMNIIKKNVLSKLFNLLEDYENISESINEYANSHINSNEFILTFDFSTSVLNFLVEAAKTRKFEVIVVDSQIEQSGAKMASELSKHSIPSALVPETSIFALMSRINKVLIGCNAILNNGGILTTAGGLLIALAAKENAVPLIIIGSSLKLTPKFALDQSTFNELMNPCKYPINERGVDILIDKFNYVAPEYLSLIISDGGEYPPEQIYRFFKEFYGPQELEIKPEEEDLYTILRKIKNK